MSPGAMACNFYCPDGLFERAAGGPTELPPLPLKNQDMEALAAPKELYSYCQKHAYDQEAYIFFPMNSVCIERD